jgi:hypothetical protein
LADRRLGLWLCRRAVTAPAELPRRLRCCGGRFQRRAVALIEPSKAMDSERLKCRPRLKAA